jgi:hypothetical protein
MAPPDLSLFTSASITGVSITAVVSSDRIAVMIAPATNAFR